MTPQTAARGRKRLWGSVLRAFALVILLVMIAIFGLLVWFTGFSDYGKCTDEEGFFGKVLCSVSAMYEEGAPFLRFLPTDEYMIRHFRRNRADFERLVQIYREDPSPPGEGGFWVPTTEARAIMARINVAYVVRDSSIWVPPDPYSYDARKEIERSKLIRRIDEGDPQARKFTGLFVRYIHPPVIRLNRYFSKVSKSYYYTPFAPKVENGLLKLAPDGGKWLFPTLSQYPPDLGSMDCAYRQIEPQWFIRLCQVDF
ncbi:MAG: hypothetical protein AB1473_06255 [Thermodesulfobacteriota bacterium]